ncbi:polysaccharide biosynthesis tyrosine autokinase [Alienimonas sp. DA493]|uniref:polysaccharide biosynthesis tyrosine autokinase n=1 Tax=Alienimonas sp. DA493 TaxID=3373605 RepID=UPI0037540F18
MRRKWFLLLVGLAAGLGGGYYHFTKQEPVYRSVAEITISYRQASLPVEVDESGRAPSDGRKNIFEDYLHRLQTPPMIARAVEAHGLKELPRFRGGSSPVPTILENLSGQHIDDTSVVRLSYVGKSPEETQAVLDAVVATFIDSVKENEQSVSQEAIELITKANDQTSKELEAAEAAYREFQKTSPLSRGADGQPLNPYTSDLVQIDARRDELRLELTGLTAEINAILAALEEGGRREALAQMASLSRQRAAEGATTPEAAALRFEEKHFELMSQLEEARERYGENHPERKRLENRYAAARALMAERAGLNGSAGESKSFLDLFIEARQERAGVLEAQIASLNQEYDATKAKADSLRDAEMTDRELRDRVTRHASMYKALVDRIAQLDLMKDADTVRVAELVPAGPGALTPVELVRSLSLGGVMGLAIAFGLAYLLEQGDHSFKSPEELRAEFAIPVLGHIPQIPAPLLKRLKGSGSLDPSLLTVHRPKSRLAESFRAVRTGLVFSRRSSLHVIQVTSADPGDGKSTLAANLAISLARSGKRTILVDADLRRPRVAKLFGLSADGVGVAEAIADPDRIEEAVVESSVENLLLLPCLSHPDHPAEMLSSGRFEEFLELLRQKFDYVILDSPPVLAVSDPAAIASSADGVVLVTRLSRRTRRKLKESLDTLDRSGANVLGLVVNGLEPGGEYTREVEAGYYYGSGLRQDRGAYYSNESAQPPAAIDVTPPAVSKRVNGTPLSV